MKKSDIKLLVMDLDGTLLTSDKMIAESSLRAINRAQQMGVKAVIASARPPRSCMPFYRQLGLDTQMVNYNGAMIKDPVRDEIALHLPLELKTAREITQVSREMYPEILISAEILDRLYTDRVDEQFATETARLFPPDLIAPIDKWLTCDVTKLLVQGADGCLEKIDLVIRRDFADEVYLVYMDNGLLQLMSRRVDKAHAVEMVAQELGISADQVLAIGDNTNDNGMLRWAGVGAAVDNATADTKKSADFVTASNDDDGPARAIEKFILTK